MNERIEPHLTQKEQDIIQILMDAKRHFIQLPLVDDTDLGDFLGALYQAETVIVSRVKERAENE